MDLAELRFKVDTTELEKADKAIGQLAASVGKLNKVSDDAAKMAAKLEAADAKKAKELAKVAVETEKVNQARARTAKVEAEAAAAAEKTALVAAKVASETAKAEAATARATKTREASNAAEKAAIGIVGRLADQTTFMYGQWSKAEARILAQVKAYGENVSAAEEYLKTQRQLMGTDPFDKSAGALRTLQKELAITNEIQNLYAQGYDLTIKQARELAIGVQRETLSLQAKGKTTAEVAAGLDDLRQKYAASAKTINENVRAEQARVKAQRDALAGAKYIADTEARLAAALDQTNDQLDRRATDTMVKYKAALVATGTSADQMAVKMAALKNQLDAVASKERAQQLQYLSRALSVQMGDVAVSLASGMNPLMVMIQQGDQIRAALEQTGAKGRELTEAMYGGAKKMAQGYMDTATAISSFLVGSFNYLGKTAYEVLTVPVKGAFEILASGITGTSMSVQRMNEIFMVSMKGVNVVLGVAIANIALYGSLLYKQMKAETDLSRAMAMKGGAMGITTDEAIAYAKANQDVAGSAQKAMEVITEMAKASNLSKTEIRMVMESAINLQKYGGTAIADTVKEFSKLKEKPVEALLELMATTGRVDEKTVRHVDSLVRQEKQAEATAIAMDALSKANKQAVDQMIRDQSPWEASWMAIKDQIQGVINAMYELANSSAVMKTFLVIWTLIATIVNTVYAGIKQVYTLLSGTAQLAFALVTGQAQKSYGIITETWDSLKQTGADFIQSQLKINGTMDAATSATEKLREEEKRLAEDRAKNQAKANELREEFKKADKDARKKPKEPATASGTLPTPRSNELEEIKKRFDGELRLAKEFNQAERDILKARFDAGLVERGQFIVKDTALLRQSEEKQLDVIDEYQSEYTKKYVERYLDLVAARDKALAANKGLKDEAKANEKILQDFSTQIENMGNASQTTFEQLDNLRKSIANAVTTRETTRLLEFAKATFENEKAYIAFGNALKDANTERQLEARFQDSMVGASEASVARLTAEYDTLKKLAPEIRKFADELVRAQTALNNVTAPESTATDAEVYAAVQAYVEAAKKARQVVADAGVAAEKAGVDAVIAYQKSEFKRMSDGISDSIVTALFEGGKSGSKKIKDILIAELKKPINVVVKALVIPIVSGVGQIFGLGGGASSAFGATAGGAESGLMSTVSGALGLGSLAGSAGLFGSGVASGLSAWAAGGSVTGLLGSGSLFAGGIANGLGLIAGALGPIALGLGALSMLMGKGGGPKAGGEGVYSVSGGVSRLATDRQLYTPSDLDLEAQNLTKAVISGIQEAVTGLGGKIGDFTVGLGFDLDPKGTAPNRISSFLSTAVGDAMRNINLDLGRDEAGLQQGLALEVQRLILAALQTAELPQQIQDIFKGVTAATATQEQIQGAMTAAKAMSDLLNTVKQLGIPLDAVTQTMIETAGGVQALQAGVVGYYQNFYSAEEKAQRGMDEISGVLEDVGIAIIPKTKSEFRALVESLDLATEAGQKQYATLINVSSAFAEFSQSAEEAANAFLDIARELMGFVNEATQTPAEAFSQTLTKALAGDKEAMRALPEAAARATETARSTASSLMDFRRAQADILIGVSQAANLAKAFGEGSGMASLLTTGQIPSAASGLEMLPALIDEMSRLPAFARGGAYQGGLALTGENGPELINFNQPGYVYDAAETKQILSGSGNSTLVQELQSLRYEVSLLRAEVRADVSHNAKTARLLDRVIPDGDSIQVSNVSNSALLLE